MLGVLGVLPHPFGKGESESVHVVRLVFFLPFAVAGLADSYTTLSCLISAGPPHVNGIVNRQRTSAHGFVSEVITVSYTAGDFPLLGGFLLFLFVLVIVFAMLACLGFEAHGFSLGWLVHQGSLAH